MSNGFWEGEREKERERDREETKNTERGKIMADGSVKVIIPNRIV
jgi:hypothetical protein